MKVIVAGCGRVGAMIANKLSSEGHSVSVVDKNRNSFERLAKNFRGQTIIGMVFDGDALREAGIERADAFVSVTSGDNSNVVAATIAKDIYRVPKVVARIYDPRRAEIYRRFGISTVSSVSWAVNELHTLLTYTEFIRDATLGDGDVQIARTDIPKRMIGRNIDEINVPSEVKVVALIRGGKAFISPPGTVLQENDLIELAVLTTSMPKLKKMFAP